jgi:hypothetical protein
MSKIILALRTFLWLALPFFRSHDRWRARGLLAGVIGADTSRGFQDAGDLSQHGVSGSS